MLQPRRWLTTWLPLGALIGLPTAVRADELPDDTSTENASETATPDADGVAPSISVSQSQQGTDQGVSFGSYGRVGFGSDDDGATPQAVNVVAHGSRVVERTYLELDLYYRLKAGRDTQLTTVTTLAFGDHLFHFDGQFDSQLALRNFYLEASRNNHGVWAGSRMYRGDDIYLLDYWPLDDANTIGAGAWYQHGPLNTAVHIGVNRLLNPFQYQQIDVMSPDQLGTDTITQLDRQRYIASAKSTYVIRDGSQGIGLKVKGFAEIQALPNGERRTEDEIIEKLPSDFGWTLGAQLGAWGFLEQNTHVNLFARLSKGLTAFDELAAPTGLSADKKAYPRASELLLGWSGNIEYGRAGMMVGGYSRRFVDADPNVMDRDDGWEYIVDARPRVDLYGPLAAAVDASFQARLPRGISPTTLTATDPSVWQVAPMVLYTPFGKGAYARPQFRAIYRAAHLNQGARDLYSLDDPRRAHEWVHFIGFQAEWWFNSTARLNSSVK